MSEHGEIKHPLDEHLDDHADDPEVNPKAANIPKHPTEAERLEDEE